MADKDFTVSLLLDIYGPMLTEKQRDVIDLYYNQDLSLSEIAEHEGITRQGVRDNIKRGEDFMREMEETLGFLKKFERLVALNERVQFLCDEIDHANKGVVTSLEIDRGIHEISDLVREYTETF